MSENDTSNLPILDDIIVPGDADKAVPTPSSKVQSLLLAEDDRAAPAVSLSTTATDLEVEQSNQANVNNTASPIAQADDHDAIATAYAPLDTEILEKPARATDNRVRSSSFNTDIEAASAEAPNIDALTKDILTSLMPAVEHLLSEKIRQTLKQHLANTDVD
jgi:hypothetical protein